ncbi:hypothetical protein AKJ65_06375 [candidate division MSBL1 archaeon SCGC-AAA259E19]|uniref:Asparagine synthase n=2 Tax=candidate division MSBL1 TaxID=215777 RepID=A0A133V5V4_9EURY|nr:hypothetical protein AKJ65_06375 [candidate division MSBL1 archaeon SCGC-AAA259E19]KXB01828.1 hypothetical protein AKJ41_00085 [candidate division MSBL1 archaeon SCGC-AAA259O05]
MEKIPFDGSTLSGGLDTSIVNYVASKQTETLKSVTVGLEGSEMKDLEYAREVSKLLDTDNHVRTFDFEGAKEVAEDVVRIMQSFDPMEIRNSIPIYVAMEEAKKRGMTRVLTGDAGDELFAGYSFLYELPRGKLEEKLEEITEIMGFSSAPIAEDLGIKAEHPFLEEEFKRFAMDLDPELKVSRYDNKKIGKWILRKAYENYLPDEIIWRKKTPIEKGSGTTTLPEKFESEIEDTYFESKSKEIREEDGVKIRSPEQLFYYEIYRKLYGPPEPEDPDARTCSHCGINVPDDATFCRTCGNGIGS